MYLKKLVSAFRSKLFNKIFFVFTLLIIVILSTVSFFLFNSISEVLRKKDNLYNQMVLRSINSYLESKLLNTRQMVRNINEEGLTTNNKVYPFLETGTYSDHFDYISDYNDFYRYFSSFFYADNDIAGMKIYKIADGMVYSLKVNHNGSDLANPADNSDNSRLSHLLTQDIIVSKAYYDNDVSQYCYMLHINIKNTQTLKNVAVLTVIMNSAGMDSLIKSYYNDPFGEIMVFTPQGDVLYDSSAKQYGATYKYFSDVNSGLKHINIDGTRYYLNRISDNKSNLVVVGLIPDSIAAHSVAPIKKLILLLLEISIVISPIFSYFASKMLSKRIHNVTRIIAKIRTGDLTQRIPTDKSNDEIARICDSFNKMCDDLQEYIERVYISEINHKNTALQLKSAELQTLQAQINPHFLYNTLEIIRMKATMQEAYDVGDMIMLLAKLLRNAINNSAVITLDEEILSCKLFLKLYQLRYDNLSVHFDIDDAILRFGILRNTIQPLLENCIIHGYQANKAFVIVVKGSLDGGKLMLEITDNGKGITADKLAIIHERMLNRSDSAITSIGLSNVRDRIQLMFGGEANILVSSEYEQGTTVTCILYPKTIEELSGYVQSNPY